VWITCKCYTILYKGQEHGQIVVFVRVLELSPTDTEGWLSFRSEGKGVGSRTGVPLLILCPAIPGFYAAGVGCSREMYCDLLKNNKGWGLT
jgi:hypothetical protein